MHSIGLDCLESSRITEVLGNSIGIEREFDLDKDNESMMRANIFYKIYFFDLSGVYLKYLRRRVLRLSDFGLMLRLDFPPAVEFS